MKKYIKAKELLETKANRKEKKPIYATRKLSIGLVSCMLGLVMATPMAHAEGEEANSPIPQVEEAAAVDNPQEEPVEEELLTAEEIQAIIDRANNLENDYYFNGNMLEELKAELRKAKADQSVNYEEAKARLIDEAIQKNTPAPKAPGEVRAAVKAPKAPTINPVSPGATTISGGGLIGSGQRNHFNSGCKIIVKVYNENKEFVEEKSFDLAVDGKDKTWSVNLDNPVKAGYTVTAVQEFNGGTSAPKTVPVKETLADQYKPKIKNENITVYTEDEWTISNDERQEIIDKFKANNSGIVDFDNDVNKIEYNNKDNKKIIRLSFSDKSSLDVDLEGKLNIIKTKETSNPPTIKDIRVVDDKIEVTFAEPFVEGTKISIKFDVLGEGVAEGQCAPDKNSNPTEYITVTDNKFIYEIPEDQKLDFNMYIQFKVKEPNKLPICSIKQVKLAHPKITEVKDPRKLTDEDKKAIDKAIRDANTVNGTSKLLNGTSTDNAGVPAAIQFDDSGNVKIFSGNDVEVTFDSAWNPVPVENADGSYKVKDGAEPEATFLVKDLVKNLGPDAPKIEETDDKKNITVNPISNSADTDIIEHTVTYTGTDDQEKKIVVKHDIENKTWTISQGSDFAKIDKNTGLITIDKLKIKNDTEVKAFVKDNGEYTKNEDKKDSPKSIFKVTKTKADQVTELGGLDPVDITKNVGDKVEWKKGVKAKDSAKQEDKTKIDELLKKAEFTDATDQKRTTKTKGDFVGKISVKFDDGSEIVVEHQKLIVKEKTAKVKVTYDANGGEGNMDGAELDKGASYTLPENKFTPPNVDQEFGGWLVGNSTKTTKPGAKITIKENTIIKASWKPIEYMVTFEHGTGASGTMDPKVVKKGDKFIIPPSTFTAPKDKEFAGWTISGKDGVHQPNEKIDISGDITLTATWIPKPGQPEGPSGPSRPGKGGDDYRPPITPDETPGDNPADPTKPADPKDSNSPKDKPEDKTPDKENPANPDKTNPEKPGDKEPGKEKDKNEEGKKPGVEDSLRIRYNPNGGHWNDNSTDILTYYYDRGNIITLINPPTREGYRFLYWKGSAYQPGDKYTVVDDHMFVAQWEKIGTKASRSNPKTGLESAAGVVCTLVASTGALYIGRKKED